MTYRMLKLVILVWLPVVVISWMQPLSLVSGLMASNAKSPFNFTWPTKKAAEVEGDLILGGLMMVHERQDDITCGPIMPQGGIQVLSLPPCLFCVNTMCCQMRSYQ